jgi:hypothetical protein
MYSFDNRPDTIAIDEPFYAYYLTHTDKMHPGRQDVLEEMSSNPKEVIKEIEELALAHSYVFVKNMGHHLTGLNLGDFKNFSHIILIRDPRRVIASLSKVLNNLELLDIAVEEQWKYYKELKYLGSQVIIVDSTEILKNPGFVLANMCQKIGIEFHDSMLSWDAGPRSIDGSWAPYYYASTHGSTGFGEYEEKEVNLSPHNEALYQRAKVYYMQLYNHSIHV